MGALGSTAISVWFVEDQKAEATFSPQVGAQSDAPETKAIYWRCVACFYASSVAVNRGRRHLFFTNADLPVVDGLSIAEAFCVWGVEVVRLPITYRLMPDAVSSWGNQFYIFDILDWIAAHGDADRYLILDTDCLWLRPVDEIEDAIDREGALTYMLDEVEHPAGEPINGVTREQLARFLRRMGGPNRASVAYHGGELFAARRKDVARIAALVPRFWAETLAGADDAPREEAHLLSVLYALAGYKDGTANGLIRRIWTTLHRYDARASDRDIAIWHLPAAKLFGYHRLFALLATASDLSDPVALGFMPATYERLMGVPRPSAGLLGEIVWYKLRERARRLFG